MQIRVLSDIHEDINERYPLNYNDDVFTVIAGDISGDPINGVVWVKKNIKNGLLVHGNHDFVYNTLGLTFQEQQDAYTNCFPLDGNVSYLNNQYKIIDDIVFIGCCLYTNYKYNGNVTDNMKLASKGLNDFRWGQIKENDNIVRLEPRHYLAMFKESFDFIKHTLKKFEDKKCVLITHHGVSPLQIAPKYFTSNINASYISDLTKFIEKQKNLKLIVTGHIHTSSDIMIGNTRVICNPYGYRSSVYGECNLNFNPNLIVEV